MKKISFLIVTLVVALLMPSCENDGGDSKIKTSKGALPNIQKISTTDAFIDLVAVQSGDAINLGFTVDLAIGDINSMDIMALYKKSDGTIYKAKLATGITTFPTTFNISQTDILNAFNELNSTGDFQIGDQLTITAELTLKDGRVQKIINDDGTNNFSPNIASSNLYKVFQTYNVSCPSDLEGTYSVISSGESTDSGPSPSENPISNFPYTVEIKATGGGDYTISDAFGGLYILWYDIYGVDFEVEGTFSDVCGTISGSFQEPFGTEVIVTGTVNPNGTLSIHWVNGYDDFGDAVYTKQ